MTLAEPYENHSLRYLKLGTGTDFTEWGQEFNLRLAGDISEEYNKRLETDEDTKVIKLLK